MTTPKGISLRHKGIHNGSVLLIQGFHDTPSILTATLTPPGGLGERPPINGVPLQNLLLHTSTDSRYLFAFQFPGIANQSGSLEAWTLKIQESPGSGLWEQLVYIPKVQHGFGGGPVIQFPSNGTNISQNFYAWGNNDGSAVTGSITDGTTSTAGTYQNTGGFYWSMQFAVANPSGNPYTLSLSDGTGGPSCVYNLTVTAYPPP